MAPQRTSRICQQGPLPRTKLPCSPDARVFAAISILTGDARSDFDHRAGAVDTVGRGLVEPDVADHADGPGWLIGWQAEGDAGLPVAHRRALEHPYLPMTRWSGTKLSQRR